MTFLQRLSALLLILIFILSSVAARAGCIDPTSAISGMVDIDWRTGKGGSLACATIACEECDLKTQSDLSAINSAGKPPAKLRDPQINALKIFPLISYR